MGKITQEELAYGNKSEAEYHAQLARAEATAKQLRFSEASGVPLPPSLAAERAKAENMQRTFQAWVNLLGRSTARSKAKIVSTTTAHGGRLASNGFYYGSYYKSFAYRRLVSR